MKINFEKWLEERFIDFREVGGMPITKDNCEDLFENYLANLQVDDWFKWADMYAKENYLRGKSEVLDALNQAQKKPRDGRRIEIK